MPTKEVGSVVSEIDQQCTQRKAEGFFLICWVTKLGFNTLEDWYNITVNAKWRQNNIRLANQGAGRYGALPIDSQNGILSSQQIALYIKQSSRIGN